RVRIGDMAAAAHVSDDLFKIIFRNAIRPKNASRVAGLFFRYRHKKVFGQDRGRIRAYLPEYRAHDALLLVEHRSQNVLRFYLLILIFFSDADGLLDGLLAP